METSPFVSRPAEPQVFVDPTGRRAVALRRLMRAVVLAFGAWMAALVLGATGFGALPAPVRPAHHAGRTPRPAAGQLARARLRTGPRGPRVT